MSVSCLKWTQYTLDAVYNLSTKKHELMKTMSLDWWKKNTSLITNYVWVPVLLPLRELGKHPSVDACMHVVYSSQTRL